MTAPAGLGPVREAAPRELEAVARCLGRAFQTDPVTSYLFPSPEDRARRAWRFYLAVARELRPHGRVLTVEGLHGAAIWRAPRPPRPGRLAQARSALRFLAVLGGSALRARGFFEALERAHVRTPHWYLGVLGTEPARQGQGVGSTLLRPMLAECDAAGLPAYLESSKRENLPFYERHGFEVRGEVSVPGSPTVWPMLREPR
jgi:GNAT superfamily N-acetyltransferase